MWLYFPVAVARNVFGASDTNSPLYSAGVEWAGVCFGMYSLVCFGFSFLLPALARQYGRKATHSFCLICGGLGLLAVALIHNKYLLLFSMAGVGIAWASTLSMPYSILAGSLPHGKTGVYTLQQLHPQYGRSNRRTVNAIMGSAQRELQWADKSQLAPTESLAFDRIAFA
jgi:maltose/moltooligosaccharide transporter